MRSTRPDVKRRAAIVVVAIMVLTACGLQDPYPIPEGQPTTEFIPAGVGEPARAVVMYLVPRPGADVVLMSAEAIGQVDGASVEFFSSPAIADGEDFVIGEQLDELAGTILPGAPGTPENTLGIVAEVTADEPGRYVISVLRLTYRYGRAEEVGEGTDVVMIVCVDDPAPSECV